MGILALNAEFENDIPRERQLDGIAKAKERGVRFDRKRELTDERGLPRSRPSGKRQCPKSYVQQGMHLAGTHYGKKLND